jgi:hypothetical protein
MANSNVGGLSYTGAGSGTGPTGPTGAGPTGPTGASITGATGPTGPAGSGALASVSAAMGTSVNDYAPAGYVGGTTNRILITPTSGGSTCTGLNASGVPDGWQAVLYNTSATISITFSNASGSSSSANQFLCPGAAAAILGPQTSVLVQYVAALTAWIFL